MSEGYQGGVVTGWSLVLTYSFLCRSSALWPLYKALGLGSASITIDGLRRLSKRQCVILWFRARITGWNLRESKTSRVRVRVSFSFSVLSFSLSLSLFVCPSAFLWSRLAHSGTWPRWCFLMALLAVSVYVWAAVCQLVETDEGKSGEFAGKQRGDLCRCGTMGPLLQRCKYPESLQTDLSLSLFLSLSLSSHLTRPLFFPRCPVLIPRALSFLQ